VTPFPISPGAKLFFQGHGRIRFSAGLFDCNALEFVQLYRRMVQAEIFFSLTSAEKMILIGVAEV